MITNKSINKFGRLNFYVYKIYNPAGEFYIGITSNIKNRMEVYKNRPEVFKKQIKLSESVKKWGWSEHRVEVLEEVSFDKRPTTLELKNVEQSYIFKAFIKKPDGCLNIVIWGQPKHYIELSSVRLKEEVIVSTIKK
jgi:hypothetical protein